MINPLSFCEVFKKSTASYFREKTRINKKPEPTLNDAIVAFLKKYEVFVTPPKSNRAIDGVITGAVTGMAGADVGGDMAMIQGQSNQTKS